MNTKKISSLWNLKIFHYNKWSWVKQPIFFFTLYSFHKPHYQLRIEYWMLTM